jgi:hypothetical protein
LSRYQDFRWVSPEPANGKSGQGLTDFFVTLIKDLTTYDESVISDAATAISPGDWQASVIRRAPYLNMICHARKKS